jgi:hypothetical protein
VRRRWSVGAILMSTPLPALAAAVEISSWAVYAVFAIVAMIVILLLLHEVLDEDEGSETTPKETSVKPGKRYAPPHGRTSPSALRRNR